MIGIAIGNFIGKGSSGSRWTPENFLTTNSASDNVTALNDALTNHSNVKITTPGIYEIDDTIWLKSNQSIEFVAGCTIKKATGSNFLHVFANKGILTATRNSNIKVIGNGLVIEQNGIDVNSLPAYRMIGNINFFRVDGLKVDNIKYLDGGPTQYFSHFADINNFSITNIEVDSDKDGLHFDGKVHDGIIDNCSFTTGDDCLAFFAKSWPALSACTGDIHDIAISNITGVRTTAGYFTRMNPGSWAVWTTGNTYNDRDFCVNAGKIYYKSNAAAIAGVNAPTHSSGAVTGADGIEWTFYQDGVITEANLYNITFDGIATTAYHGFHIPSDMDIYTRDIYPGTEGNAYSDNILIKNIVYTVPSVDSMFLSIENFCKTITIDNLSVVDGGFNYNIISISKGDITIDELNLNNCNIDSNRLGSLFELEAGDVATININNSILSNIKGLISTAYNDFLININAIGSSFINKVETLLEIGGATNSVINFVADNCTFEEPWKYLFRNNNATCQLNVTTTNSLGESIPSNVLVSGSYVDVTNCDLTPIALGDNICTNGKFRIDVTGWSGERGVVEWMADETMRYTVSGAAGNNDIAKGGLYHLLSNNLNIKFKAKAIGTTNTIIILNGTLVAISNPALSENWQNYEFTLAIGAATIIYLKVGASLAAGVIVDFDDVQVVQY